MNDAASYVLHGAPGSDAVPVHAALTLIGAPVQVVDVSPWESEDERERLRDVNPMRQVPVLRLPDGQTMTESAAMLIWLADRHPEARLAPTPDAPLRAQFLRWMCFIPASIYSMFWVRDVPTRLVAGDAGIALMRERTAERIAECWRTMDAQVREQLPQGTPYLFGDDIGVLDLYVAVASRWTPRRRRFYRDAPRMAEVVRRVDADPRLAAFWAARFPFDEGWEDTGV
ncbi:glutathione S-transferase family protein [Xenophilus aerolatus]|nr:glutathione S-transferase family protein [Xenophilus aerolatus]